MSSSPGSPRESRGQLHAVNLHANVGQRTHDPPTESNAEDGSVLSVEDSERADLQIQVSIRSRGKNRGFVYRTARAADTDIAV